MKKSNKTSSSIAQQILEAQTPALGCRILQRIALAQSNVKVAKIDTWFSGSSKDRASLVKAL